MKNLQQTMMLVLVSVSLVGSLVAEDYPFPIVEDVPERVLIGVDQHGHPRIADKDKSRVASLAADDSTPKHFRFYAIWGLAISGYSSESATGLALAIENRSLSDTDRGYAAMGLCNFTPQLPNESMEILRSRLRKVVGSESKAVPDGILRTLIIWGDAPWIVEQLGEGIAGHPMEIEILSALMPEQASRRLLELYRATERRNVRESYNRKAEIGRALLNFHDKRGIDILETLLDADAVPEHDGTPNHQYRHNVFAAITKGIGDNFGYKQLNYHPSIDASIRRFRDWWFENRYNFGFPEKGPNPEAKSANKAANTNQQPAPCR